MMVCHTSPSEISGRFIGTTGIIGAIGGGGCGSTTGFSTFLFCTTGNGVRVAFGDCDLLRKL